MAGSPNKEGLSVKKYRGVASTLQKTGEFALDLRDRKETGNFSGDSQIPCKTFPWGR
jgi:hypothetical protein